MEEQTERLKLPIVETSPPTKHPWYLLISGLFIVAAIIFAGKVGAPSTTIATVLRLLAVMRTISSFTLHAGLLWFVWESCVRS